MKTNQFMLMAAAVVLISSITTSCSLWENQVTVLNLGSSVTVKDDVNVNMTDSNGYLIFLAESEIYMVAGADTQDTSTNSQRQQAPMRGTHIGGTEPTTEYSSSDKVIECEMLNGVKTSLGNMSSSTYTLVWKAGDCISINDGTSTAVYTTSNDNMTSALFQWRSGSLSNSAQCYTAFYPASLTKDNMVLPVQQEYVENDVKDFPMYAQSYNRQLQFHNLCGIVQFDITDKDQSADYAVSAIHLSCEGKGMSGAFTIGSDYAAVVSGDNGVSLKCSVAQSLSSTEAKSFNIIVPAGNYDNLKAVVVFSDGSERTYKSNGIAKVKRSSIVRYAISINASELSGSLELIPIVDGDVDFTER